MSAKAIKAPPKSEYGAVWAKRDIDFEKCRRSAHYFIFEDHLGSRLMTKDEHDAEPIKPFPDIPYLRVLLDALLVSGKLIKPEEARYALESGIDLSYLTELFNRSILCIEKSRHVLATWLMCAFWLWRAKFISHRLLIVQSKREEDAANLVFNKEPQVGRISFMESKLPKHLRSVSFPKGGSYGHLFFPNGSHVWAIPEGGDIIRSNNPSGIFSDESAFQPQFGSSYSAALASIKGGGQLICVSSAEVGEFQELVESV